MFKMKNFWILLILAFTLVSCDAMLHMTYAVKNKSLNEVKLFVPNFPVDSLPHMFGQRKDTIFTLKPNEEIIVGIESKIDFPWGRKNIYRNRPGICGIKRISKDTITTLGCSEKEWKYKKGQSWLKLE